MKQLRIPGPTPLPPKVRQVLARQMINHRGSEFKELLTRLTQKFQRIFQTQNDVLFLSCSGTGGMEASIANLFSPKEKIIVFSMGSFGDRFAEIALRYGLEVATVRVPNGQPVTEAVVKETLSKYPEAKAVLITHNETSTAVTNNLAKLAPIIKEAGKLLIVDAISSLAAIPLAVDTWRIDVAISASQKATMAPPGIAMITVSPAAWHATKTATLPRFYFDLELAKKYAEKGQTPATPTLSTLRALDVASDLILKTGLEKTFQIHATRAIEFRGKLEKAGFILFSPDNCASYTLTAAMLPENLQGRTDEFIGLVKKRFGIEFASGQESLKGKIFRVAHMGYVTEKALDQVVRALVKTKKSMLRTPTQS